MASGNENTGTNQGVGLPMGSKVGKYEVVERQGVGGQAIVYKCYDKSLDRFVAIKQISPHLAEDPKFVERFRSEARILARLGAEGTSIVTIHELLEEPNGLFIVMEFVTGHTLEQILRDTNGPTEPKAALQILWRLAAALHSVHAAGIIHRDLKPGNIIVSEGLRPKITDFGVAASRTGQTSMLLGTTKYMAPELFAGGEVDGRSDLYSLGMIAYELLLGRPRFNEVFAEVVRDPHSEALRWMKWHSNEQEVAPPLHELNPAIPEALSEIVVQMMAKKRENRFESMEALGRAIRVSFSPRGKATGVATGTRRGGKAAARAGAGAMAAGEGDELEIQGPPKTAAIPRTPMGLRTKILLAAVAFSMILSGVIVLVVRSSAANKRLAEAAQIAFKAAEEYYNAGNLEDALAGFEGLLPKFPGTTQAAKASVRVYQCRIGIDERKAVTPQEWNDLAAEVEAAKKQALKVQSERKDLEKWTGDILVGMEDQERNRLRLRKYRTEMAKANEAFAAKQYVECVGILNLLTGDLTDEQKKGRDALKQKAARAEFDRNYAAALDKGDELAALNDFKKDVDYDAAKAAYDNALRLLNANGNILSPDEIGTMNKDLTGKMGLLAKKRDYRRAVKDYELAKDPQEKLKALLVLQNIAPTPEIAQQIKQAQAERSVQKANEALELKKPDEARRFAQQALKDVPGYAPAAAIIEKLDAGEKRQTLVTEGTAFLNQGKCAEALDKLTKAADLGSDQDLDTKIVECRFQLLLAEGDKLRDEKKWDDAVKSYEKALVLKPSDKPIVDAREAVVKKAKLYQDNFAKGEESLKGKQYGNARGAYMEARRALDTPEVNQRISLTSYMENLDQGKTALGLRRFDEALAYFKVAKGHQKNAGVEPDEVDGLLRKAEDGVKGSSP
jgi:serine/threonine-protein kinase